MDFNCRKPMFKSTDKMIPQWPMMPGRPQIRPVRETDETEPDVPAKKPPDMPHLPKHNTAPIRMQNDFLKRIMAGDEDTSGRLNIVL